MNTPTPTPTPTPSVPPQPFSEEARHHYAASMAHRYSNVMDGQTLSMQALIIKTLANQCGLFAEVSDEPFTPAPTKSITQTPSHLRSHTTTPDSHTPPNSWQGTCETQQAATPTPTPTPTSPPTVSDIARIHKEANEAVQAVAASNASLPVFPTPERLRELLLAKIRKTLPAPETLTSQVGGEHYQKFLIQPAEFTILNQLGSAEASAIWYICRHQDKQGAQDIRKAIHFLEMVLELTYGDSALKSYVHAFHTKYCWPHSLGL